MAKENKLPLIIQNFFSKSAQVILTSRLAPLIPQTLASGSPQSTPPHSGSPDQPKTNRWFNLEMEEIESFKEALKPWKTADPANNIAPLVIETFLDLTALGPQHNVMLTVENESDGQRSKIPVTQGSKKTEIVLERWLIQFVPGEGAIDWNDPNAEQSAIYKHVNILMRGVYTLVGMLPVNQLKRKLNRSKLTVPPLKVGCRVLNWNERIPSKGRFGLSKKIPELDQQQQSDTVTFPAVKTPIGSLKIVSSYRIHSDFYISDTEGYLSSNFFAMDQPIPPPSPSLSQTRIPLKPTHHPSLQPFKTPSLSASPSSETAPMGIGSLPRTISNSSLAAARIPHANRVSSSPRYSSSFSMVRGGRRRTVDSEDDGLAEFKNMVDEFVGSSNSGSSFMGDRRRSSGTTPINPMMNASSMFLGGGGESVGTDKRLMQFQNMKGSYSALSESMTASRVVDASTSSTSVAVDPLDIPTKKMGFLNLQSGSAVGSHGSGSSGSATKRFGSLSNVRDRLGSSTDTHNHHHHHHHLPLHHHPPLGVAERYSGERTGVTSYGNDRSVGGYAEEDADHQDDEDVFYFALTEG